MIVSIAIAVLPVWRSPMISSRWPRPIGIIASIAFRPVCIGSFTGWRWTTPGALNSAGRRLGRLDVALAVERVAERVDDAAEQGLADRDLEQAAGALDRVALDDLLPLAEQHGADVVGLEVQREAGDVVRQLEHLERHAVLEAVDARDAVGDRQHGADLGQVGLPLVEALDAALEDGGDLVGLDLHVVSPRTLLGATCLRSWSRRLRIEASRIELPTRRTMPPRMSGSTVAVSSTLRPVCSPIRSPMLLTVALVELDRAGDLDGQQLVLLAPTARRTRAGCGRCAGMRWFSISSSRKFTRIGSAPSTACSQPVLLLLGGEVGREEEHLQLAVVVERVGELAELLAHLVELVLLLRRPRTASARRPRRSPPWR